MSALVMAVRGRGTGMEAEPVLASVEGGCLTLELDDGDRLVFDFDELLTILGRDRESERQCGPAPSSAAIRARADCGGGDS